MLKAKTRKFQVPPKTYTWIGLKNVAAEWWWAWLVPAAMLILAAIFPSQAIWLSITALSLTLLYILFWYIQFAGMRQLEQTKMIFEKMSYEFDGKQIAVKLNPKQGMMLQWPQIKTVYKTKDAYVFKMSLVQFLYLPFDVFNSPNDIKFLEALLEKKGYIKK